MNLFLLQPLSVLALTQALLLLIVCVYLLSIKQKTGSTWLLAIAFGLLGLNWLQGAVDLSFYATLPFETDPLDELLVSLVLYVLLLFAYSLFYNPFGRESKIVLAGVGLLVGANTIYQIYQMISYTSMSDSGALYIELTHLLMILVSLSVYLRKRARLSKGIDVNLAGSAGFEQAGKEKAAFRAFALLAAGLMLLSFRGIWIAATFIWPQLGVPSPFLVMVNLPAFILLLLCFLVVYINYMPEPTTFQAKIIGLSLATLLAVLGIADPILFSNENLQREGLALVPDHQTLRFEPEAEGGYRLTRVPFQFDADLGENLHLRQEADTLVALDFVFPLFGRSWENMYIDPNGLVAFGRPYTSRGFDGFYSDEQPRVAPYYRLLIPPETEDSGVFYKSEAGKVTVTWNLVREGLGGDSTNLNTVQLVLYERGAIDFVYDRLEAPFDGQNDGFRGLSPGGEAISIELAAFELSDTSANPPSAGAMLVEDFGLLYRRFVHAKMVPLACIVLLSTLFILGVFPLFFRTSLIKPLESLLTGVRHVDEGNLDTSIPIRVNDEIGILAQNFNRMTISLKTAKEQLNAYAEGLEEKVAERTADLEHALNHLTETQDQLIHAEKMASLGSLTAGIAHEIKNPLNFINNFSELSIELVDDLVQEMDALPEQLPEKMLEEVDAILTDLKQNAEKIKEHGQRADRIVKSMLEHSSSGAGRRQTVEVNALVNQYIELAHHGMQASIPEFSVKIEKNFGASAGEVEMAPQEIGRVLVSLLNNAFYAVREKSLSNDERYEPAITVSTKRMGSEVEIRVQDNGPGIARDIRKHIFEPFFTTKPTGTVTGLGLSLSHDIVVRGHGGTLEVQSEEGEGASFIIKLPAMSVMN